MRLETNLQTSSTMCWNLMSGKLQPLAFRQAAFSDSKWSFLFDLLWSWRMEKAGNATHSQKRGELTWNKYSYLREMCCEHLKGRNPVPCTCWRTKYWVLNLVLFHFSGFDLILQIHFSASGWGTRSASVVEVNYVAQGHFSRYGHTVKQTPLEYSASRCWKQINLKRSLVTFTCNNVCFAAFGTTRLILQAVNQSFYIHDESPVETWFTGRDAFYVSNLFWDKNRRRTDWFEGAGDGAKKIKEQKQNTACWKLNSSNLVKKIQYKKHQSNESSVPKK